MDAVKPPVKVMLSLELSPRTSALVLLNTVAPAMVPPCRISTSSTSAVVIKPTVTVRAPVKLTETPDVSVTVEAETVPKLAVSASRSVRLPPPVMFPVVTLPVEPPSSVRAYPPPVITPVVRAPPSLSSVTAVAKVAAPSVSGAFEVCTVPAIVRVWPAAFAVRPLVKVATSSEPLPRSNAPVLLKVVRLTPVTKTSSRKETE